MIVKRKLVDNTNDPRPKKVRRTMQNLHDVHFNAKDRTLLASLQEKKIAAENVRKAMRIDRILSDDLASFLKRRSPSKALQLQALLNINDDAVAPPNFSATLILYITDSLSRLEDVRFPRLQVPPNEASDESSKRLSLLDLPAELKVRIFEEALQSPETIRVNKHFREPSILSVNRRSRKESKPIFYGINKFSVPVHNCNATLYNGFLHHLSNNVGIKTNNVHVALTGKPNWKNLTQWCKAIHRGDSTRAAPYNTSTPQDRHKSAYGVVTSATEMAQTMRGVDWAMTEEVLHSLKHLAETFQSEWQCLNE